MSTKAELACVYSALLLIDDDVAVTVSSIILLSLVNCTSFRPVYFQICTWYMHRPTYVNRNRLRFIPSIIFRLGLIVNVIGSSFLLQSPM